MTKTNAFSLADLRNVEFDQLRELDELIGKARDLAGQIAQGAYDRSTYRMANHAVFELATLRAKLESHRAHHTSMIDKDAPREDGY